jgi:hypothetical protein
MKRFVLPLLLIISIISLITTNTTKQKQLNYEYLDSDMLFSTIDNKRVYTKLINSEEEPKLLILTEGQENVNIRIYDFNKSSYTLDNNLGYISDSKPFKIRISSFPMSNIYLFNSTHIITVPTFSPGSISVSSLNGPYKDLYPSSYYNFFVYESSPNILKSNSKDFNIEYILTPKEDNNFILNIHSIVSIDTLNNTTIYYNKPESGGMNLYSYPLNTNYTLSPLEKETLAHENIYYSSELFSDNYSRGSLSISKKENNLYNLKLFSDNTTDSLNIKSSKTPIASGYKTYAGTKIVFSSYDSSGKIISYNPLDSSYETLCYNLPYIENIDICPSLGNPNKYLMLFRTNDNGEIRYHLYNSLDPFEKDITNLILN